MTGNQLKAIRVALNLRQEDLARELKVVVSSVARWEQLKDEEIPNSKMLELALRTVGGNFLIYNLNKDSENVIFSKEHQLVLSLFPKLNQAMDTVLIQIKPSGNVEMVVYMLGRLCVRHYESILLLCSNGHGFAAMRILRSMFEKIVDAAYLNKHPEKIDDFLNYHLVNLKKQGFTELAKELDNDYEKIIDTLRSSKSKRLRSNWADTDLVSKAQSVGCDEWIINHAYRIPNEFVHSSVAEIVLSLTEEKDGTVTAVESENASERKLADVCFNISSLVLIETLKILIGAFNLPEQPALDEYEQEFKEVFDWRLGK